MRSSVPEPALQIEHADLSLLGNREENQDRVAIAVGDGATMLVVADGMGGHSDGARAAERAVDCMLAEFWGATHPLFDPEGFLHLTIGRAHEAVAELGRGLPSDVRPRATCAVCIVQRSGAHWAHVGDSRVYLLRDGAVLYRTRDHSHVELLLRTGRITERQAQEHPMRNYVECCIGGDPTLPEMSLGGRRTLLPGDVLLLCSDGLWGGLSEEQIGALTLSPPGGLQAALQELGERSLRATAPHADNTTAAALRWRGS